MLIFRTENIIKVGFHWAEFLLRVSKVALFDRNDFSGSSCTRIADVLDEIS
jgi:hypothetical protein